MDDYWVDINGANEDFWSHEWSKHGTCINTIEPSCYSGYKAQEEVGDFFQRTVDLFKTLDTYKVCPLSAFHYICCSFLTVCQALSAAGITPSTSKTYTLSAIQKALTTLHGASVYLGCSSGKLNEVWYFYNVKGNAIDGTYKAVDTRKFYHLLLGWCFTDVLVILVTTSSCPTTGIKYVPK